MQYKILFRTYVGSFITSLKPTWDDAKSILENSKVMLFLYQPYELELKSHNATIRKFKAFNRIFPIHLFCLTWRSIKTNELTGFVANHYLKVLHIPKDTISFELSQSGNYQREDT